MSAWPYRISLSGSVLTAGLLASGLGSMTGCGAADLSALLNGSTTGTPAEVAAKAEQVAQQIGGSAGFGGSMMGSYGATPAAHMGFQNSGDLASPNGSLSIMFSNGSSQLCTFHLAYLRSADGLDIQTRDFSVSAGQDVTFEMPCAEIVGLGSLSDVGAPAVTAADGAVYDNRYCVPGFLHTDFACGGNFTCTLGPDVNDINQNGDTHEMIMRTSAMLQHMPSGMMGSGRMMNGAARGQ